MKKLIADRGSVVNEIVRRREEPDWAKMKLLMKSSESVKERHRSPFENQG